LQIVLLSARAVSVMKQLDVPSSSEWMTTALELSPHSTRSAVVHCTTWVWVQIRVSARRHISVSELTVSGGRPNVRLIPAFKVHQAVVLVVSYQVQPQGYQFRACTYHWKEDPFVYRRCSP
jgi:hypothetical protein